MLRGRSSARSVLLDDPFSAVPPVWRQTLLAKEHQPPPHSEHAPGGRVAT